MYRLIKPKFFITQNLWYLISENLFNFILENKIIYNY